MSALTIQESSVARIPVELYEADFIASIDKTIQLLKGFYIKRPPEQRAVIHQTYVRFMRIIEETKNSEYKAKLEAEEGLFSKKFAQLYMDNRRAFDAKKARHLHDVGQELLQSELGLAFAKDLRLKIDRDTFMPDRWIVRLINTHIFELEKYILPSELYRSDKERHVHQTALAKIKAMPENTLYPELLPGLFVSPDELELYRHIEERKDFLLRDLQERERKKILSDECDFSLIHSNVGYGGLGSGRSPYGSFTGEAISHLSKTSKGILDHFKLTSGKLHKHKSRLEKIPTDERLILVMNAFVDTYSRLQWLRNCSLVQIAQNVLKKSPPNSTVEPLPLFASDEVKLQFKEKQKKISDICRKARGGATPSSFSALNRESLEILKIFSEGFFNEIQAAYIPLRDQITLLEIHLEKDFSKDDKSRAHAITKAMATSTGAATDGSNLASSPSRKGSLSFMASPGRKMSLLTTPRAGPIDQWLQETPRRDTNSLSARTILTEIKAEDYIKIEQYVESLKIVVDILNEIRKVVRKKR